MRSSGGINSGSLTHALHLSDSAQTHPLHNTDAHCLCLVFSSYLNLSDQSRELISNVWSKMEKSTTEKHITNLSIENMLLKVHYAASVLPKAGIVCNLKCIVTSSETKLIEDVSNMY